MVSNFFNTLHLRYRSSGVGAMFSPRKPRNPLLRLLLGLVGLALLAALLVVGVVVGLAMLAAGVAARVLLRGPRAPVSPHRRRGALDGEFRVVDRSLLR